MSIIVKQNVTATIAAPGRPRVYSEFLKFRQKIKKNSSEPFKENDFAPSFEEPKIDLNSTVVGTLISPVHSSVFRNSTNIF